MNTKHHYDRDYFPAEMNINAFMEIKFINI